ncbi:MAG: DUF3311 domain-containing protein [Desulfitobacteriaceae bacterium]
MKVIYFLALIPFIGILGGISTFANKVTPYILGLPFILFWIVSCVVATSAIIGIIYKLDPSNKGGEV